MFNHQSNNGIEYWTAALLEQAGLQHAFLGRAIDFRDRQAAKERLAVCFGPAEISLLRQTHSVIFHGADAAAQNPEGDGWLIETGAGAGTGRLFGVLTADCVPVIAYLPERGGKRGKAAILHCGWRGAVAGLLERALTGLLADGGRADDLIVAIGPGASSCCFRIGSEIVEQFSLARRRIALAENPILTTRGGELFADIKELLLRQAQFYGAPRQQISVSPLCTICDPRFYSHRREKELAGRQVTFAAARHPAI